MRFSTPYGICDSNDNSWKFYWTVPIPDHVAEIVEMIENGTITRATARTVMQLCVEQNRRIITKFFNDAGFDIIIKDKK